MTHCSHVLSCRLSPCLTCLEQFRGLFFGSNSGNAPQHTNAEHSDDDVLHPMIFHVFVLITVFICYSYYETKAVFLAMGITAVVCIAVTIFCFQTKVAGDVNCVSLCRSVARGSSEDVFVVSVKERLCLTLQWGTEFL